MMFRKLVTHRYKIVASHTITLPKDSYLFHGSIEEFSGSLKPGGDGMIWFADSPKIAQLYIPRSGLTMYVQPEDIARPDKDKTIQNLQRELGIEYDYDEVEWEGRMLKSFPSPKGWNHIPKENEVAKLLEDRGFEKDGRSFKIMKHGERFLKSGGYAEGRLFVAKTKEPLNLWIKATGESDLTNLQYHDMSGFKKAQQAGLDGVLIDDFAQSKEHGNFGHLSVGIYDIDKLEMVKVIPAQYREWDYKAKGTPEYPNPPSSYFKDLLHV